VIQKLPHGLKTCLLVTDLGFLAYWSVTALAAVGVLAVPQDWLLKAYHEPRVIAWNWSFMPLDVALSIAGLTALRWRAKDKPGWKPLLTISLALTFCAGLLAISYWAILREFDWVWWGMNLFLMLWPFVYLRWVLDPGGR
jgi:hypothetical protein